MSNTRQILAGNITNNGSKGSIEKYNAEHVELESSNRLIIEHGNNDSDVTLQGRFHAYQFHAKSDRRLKSNIANLENTSDIFDKLYPKTYNLNHESKKSYGLIAQDLEELLPELVHTNEDGIKSISYIELIPILIAEIKTLKQLIN